MHKRLRKAALVAVGLAASLVLTTLNAPSAAAAARPDFQLPFPCNEVWRGKTFPGHSPGNAIDFNQGSGSDDLGKPVVASAPGVVDFAGTGPGGYGNLVIIGHGNGWQTYHAHLSSIAVDRNEPVRAGDRIGRVGSTGGDFSPHLHYEQRLSGDDVRIVFNGVAVEYFSEKNYTSRNCGGGIEPVDMSVSGVADADGSLTIFARRGGNLWTKNRRTDGSWGDWVNRGGELASGPDAAVTAAGFYHVVARGENGKVIYKRQGETGWGEWHNTFSDFNTPYAPAIVPLDGNSLIVLAVRASDGVLLKRRYDAANGWEANWSRLGNGDEGGYTSGPDASLRDGGKVDVVIRGAGGRVKHIVRNADGAWSAPHTMGDNVFADGVALATASRKAGTVDFLARGENGYVWRNTLTAESGWTGWDRIFVGQLNQGPDLVADTGAGALQLLGRDTDGRIVRATWDPGQGWSNLIPIPTN